MSMESQKFGDLLNAIGAKTPTPGGGAVAAAVGALGASLAHMVLSYSIGKKNLAQHEAELQQAAHSLTRARELMLALAAEDEAAYGALNELLKLQDTDPRRLDELPGAATAATQAPLTLMAVGCDLLRLFERLAAITNKHLRSDLAIAAILCESTVRASGWNVRMNLPLLKELGIEGETEATASRLAAESRRLLGAIETACV